MQMFSVFLGGGDKYQSVELMDHRVDVWLTL